MLFSEALNAYMNEYGITVSALADQTAISKATISRFRTGKRVPAMGNDAVAKLAEGIVALANSNGAALSIEDVLQALNSTLAPSAPEFDQVVTNLNVLIDALNINGNDLSRFLKFDPSYLSRIRSGQRKPANVSEFCRGVSQFAAKLVSEKTLPILAHLIDIDEDRLFDPTERQDQILKWLSRGTVKQDDALNHFLMQLDAFDLNEYTRAIKFDELKVPSFPFQLPTSKTYYGMEKFEEAQLNWLKATALNPRALSVTMYNDMPIIELSKNEEFLKKWMFGLAMLLKKGVRLNMIHNVDRSIYEMMVGLEGWIPLYMTGQIDPYYFKGFQDPVFHHFLHVSPAAALAGESIVGYHGEARFHLTKNKEELAYYQKRADYMLSRAKPLMEIYRSDKAALYRAWMDSALFDDEANYRSVSSTPPLYTLSDDLLQRLLDHNEVSEEDRSIIVQHVKEVKSGIEKRLANSTTHDDILLLDKAEFEAYPVALSLADRFLETKLIYTYEEYCEHLALTEVYAAEHENFSFSLNKGQPFRNIQIRISEGNFVIISKNDSPMIHFVIRHPKLRKAIETLTIRSN